MTYSLTKQQFAGKIHAIKATTGKLKDEVQAALLGAVYLCIKDNGNTTPFQQIVDAVGTAAHRRGITQWAETYAPVLVREGGFKLNKTAYKELDAASIVADFGVYAAKTGMADVKWYDIAKDKNPVESAFNLDTTLDKFVKKLEKNGLAELAARIRQAEQDYMRDAIKAELSA